MSELPPGWTVAVEESTANHWIGACGDVVMVFAYEGSHDDVRHVQVAARLVERLSKQRGGPVRLLFVVPPLHSKPPDANVRGAFAQVARRLDTHLARAAIVIAGTGFAAALHRGAVTGVLALLRPKIPVRVVGDLREGLAYLLEGELAPLEPLVAHCAAHALGPAGARPPPG